MSDSVGTQLTKIDELQSQLEKYIAKPNLSKGEAEPTPTLNAVETLLNVIYGINPKSDINETGREMSKALRDAATVTTKIGDEIGNLAGKADALLYLQSALATANALAPGGNSALASGSLFFNQLSDLLNTVGSDVGKARDILHKLAQQFNAIAKALDPNS